MEIMCLLLALMKIKLQIKNSKYLRNTHTPHTTLNEREKKGKKLNPKN